MLPVSLDCPFLIAPSVSSNDYLHAFVSKILNMCSVFSRDTNVFRREHESISLSMLRFYSPVNI
jgi:hypothetical protein